MFKPNELERFSMMLEPQMRAMEERIMADVVRRLKINGEITRAADWQIHRAYELGLSKRKVTKIIQQEMGLSYKEVKTMYRQVVQMGYSRDEKLYKYKGVAQIPFEENAGLQQLISAVATQTYENLQNITQSLGFAARGEGGKLVFKPLADYYQQTLDAAMLDIASGAFDYNTVLKRTVSEMTNSGLRTIDYATGWKNRVNVATRRAVMTGMSQLTAKVNDDNAKALGTDHFEIEWHSGFRPEHWWGGKVFTKEELYSVCGLGEVTGLCGVNCYHDYYPFLPGISERSYTDEELADLDRKEKEKVEFGGKKYNKYEATQHQRKLETTMRAQREKISLLKEGGADEQDIINARAQYRVTSAEYARFSKAMELPQQRERVYVDGLGNIGAGKYTPAQKIPQIVPSPIGAKVMGKVSDVERDKLLKYPVFDVTQVYKSQATPKKGSVIFEKDYDALTNKEEVRFSQWLFNNYGGKIELLKEVNKNKISTPDYRWNGKLWDLKSVTTEKAALSQVRKGLKQIYDNPGGIILNYGDNDVLISKVLENIDTRMRSYNGAPVDVMIVKKNKTILIYRYNGHKK